METKANYVLIGASTIIGLFLIMLFALWITTGDLRRGFNSYDVVFDDPVRGLTEGGEVRFNGIKVGEVESLRIDPDDLRTYRDRRRAGAALDLPAILAMALRRRDQPDAPDLAEVLAALDAL